MVAGMRIAVTGADGFVGRNLQLRLNEQSDVTVLPITRGSSIDEWNAAIGAADAVIHLAGVNRPADGDFSGNVAGAEQLVAAVTATGRSIPVIVASSTQATNDSEYGRSKRAGEDVLLKLNATTGSRVAIFRLPNVFGKWSRPDYNSAVATFCHNIARGLPITVNDPAAPLSLIYVDDVIDGWLQMLATEISHGLVEAGPVYDTTVGEVAERIKTFRDDRANNLIEDVGTGLKRALYATYVSFLPISEFSYAITSHRDPRGAFSEMLKTRSAGQFSYFNALPGVTRGGHYHHTKTEKFLIVYGQARFKFRHMLTGETHSIDTSADIPQIVETVPGWTHDVTNIGDDIMVSMLWANELFDRARPDTIAAKV